MKVPVVKAIVVLAVSFLVLIGWALHSKHVYKESLNAFRGILMKGEDIAAMNLREIKYPIERLLNHLLDDPDPAVRSMSILTLTAMNQQASVPMIRRRLRDPQPSVRFFAAQALGKMGDEHVALDLCTVLSREPDWQVRHEICLSILRIGSSQVTDCMIDIFEAGDEMLQAFSAVCLHVLTEDNRWLDHLKGVASSNDPALRSRTVWMIQNLESAKNDVLLAIFDDTGGPGL